MIQGPNIRITADTQTAWGQVQSFANSMDDRFNRSAYNVRNTLGKALNTIGSTARTVFGLASRAATSFGNIISALFGQRLLATVFNTINKFAALENIFNTFSKSAGEAAQQMEFLVESSSRLGFNVTDLATSYQKFFTAGTLVGLSSDKLQETFSALSEAAVVAGLDSRQMEGALRAVFQMMSKGKVQAEELRGQLGEFLPGAFETAAKALKMTTMELDKALEQGKVTIHMLLENFPAELRKAFGPGLEGAMKLPRRELERLKNDISLFIKAFDAPLKALATTALETIRRFTTIPDQTFVDSITDKMIVLGGLIKSIPEIISSAFSMIGVFFKPLLDILKEITINLNAVFTEFLELSGSNFSSTFDFIRNVLRNFFVYFKTGFLTIATIANGTWGIIKEGSTAAFAGLQSTLVETVVEMKRLAEVVKAVFLGMGYIVGNIVQVATAGLTTVIGLYAKVADFVGADTVAALLMEISETPGRIVKSVDDALNDSIKSLISLGDEIDNIRTERADRLTKAFVNIPKIFEQAAKDMSDIANNANLEIGEQDAAYAAILGKLKEVVNTNIEYVGGLVEANKHLRYMNKATEDIKKPMSELLKFWMSIAKEITASISDGLTTAFREFLETGKMDFKKFALAIAHDIQTIIFAKLISEPIANSIAGAVTKGAGSGGWLEKIIGTGLGIWAGGGMGSAAANTAAGTIGAGTTLGIPSNMGLNAVTAARGADFTVKGRSGTDKNLLMGAVSKGERVQITPRNKVSDSMKKVQSLVVKNSFYVNSPTGTVSYTSQAEIAKKAGRAITRAISRNS